MSRPEFLIRMDKEQEELQEKIQKLEIFIFHNPDYSKLSTVEQVHMSMQLAHMRGYASVLYARIVGKNVELSGV